MRYHDAIQSSDGFHDDDIMIVVNAPGFDPDLGQHADLSSFATQRRWEMLKFPIFGASVRHCENKRLPNGDLWPFSSQSASAGKCQVQTVRQRAH